MTPRALFALATGYALMCFAVTLTYDAWLGAAGFFVGTAISSAGVDA